MIRFTDDRHKQNGTNRSGKRNKISCKLPSGHLSYCYHMQHTANSFSKFLFTVGLQVKAAFVV